MSLLKPFSKLPGLNSANILVSGFYEPQNRLLFPRYWPVNVRAVVLPAGGEWRAAAAAFGRCSGGGGHFHRERVSEALPFPQDAHGSRF